MAHIRQSRPDSGLAIQVKVLKIFRGLPSPLGRGYGILRVTGIRHASLAEGIALVRR